MSNHVSIKQCEGFAIRKIGGMEALRIELHLRDCLECFRRADDVFFEHNGFRFCLEELASFRLDHPAQEHLEYNDKLEAYLTGRLSDFHKEDVEMHCRLCRKCRRLVALAQKEMRVRNVRLNEAAVPWKPQLGFLYQVTWAVATLLIGALVGLLIWTTLWAPGAYDGKVAHNPEAGGAQQGDHQGSDSPTAVRSPFAPAPENNAPNEDKQNPQITRPRNQSSTIDGLLIARAYDIKKPSNLPGDESDEHSDEQARGGTPEAVLAKGWKIVGPMTTLVRSQTPQFRWTSKERGDTYEVSIYDDAFNLVDSSGPITTTRWRSRKALSRGQQYRWMVTAEKDGKEIFAAPPNGAAFKVINEEGLIELRNKLRGTRSPVARGLVYAEAGLLPEAEGEFGMYLESHNNDKQVEELLRRVRSWHD